jgi:CheY-like chemotaxis protein
MLCEMLESGGFSVLAIEHPAQVDRFGVEPRPSLFLIDMMLPGRTGIELAEQLRVAGFADTPMIAMSASRLMTQNASRSGLFQRTLDKPFDLSVLLDCLEHYVT